MILIIMGVSGSGKSTLAVKLSEELGWKFYEGDSYHPKENVDKMSRGIPLNDDDRKPWLLELRKIIDDHIAKNENAILTCSALKKSYRELLKAGDSVKFIYLKGDFNTIHKRMERRDGHYMKAGMLQSQFDALEEPADAVTLDTRISADMLTQMIIAKIKNGGI